LKNPNGFLSEGTVIMIGIQMCERLRDLHTIGITHNDIKPDNILLDPIEPDKIILIDFGLSSEYIDRKNNSHILNT